MKPTVNYHTHTLWCDGKNTAREMIEAALGLGFTELGFSSHGDMVRDIPAYIAEIRALAAEYADRIRVLCGLEAEGGDDLGFRDRLDYVIGSVHYVAAPDGARVCVDDTPEKLQSGIREHFAGDAVAFVRAYFSDQREMLSTKPIDVLGHPDLVRKFNLKHPYFDEQAPWYRAELVRMADAIAAWGGVVEVNTGAISRGWLDDAYPSPGFRRLLHDRGVRFILSSDAHSASGLDCAFDRFADAENWHDRRSFAKTPLI